MADAEQIFRDTLHAVAEDHNINNYDLTVTPLSTGGANYTSHLFLAKIHGTEDVHLFGKVAACGDKMREGSPVKLYDNECFFYNILSKLYRELEEKSNVTEEKRLKLPKYYGCNPNLYKETIILEDLGSKGFTTHDRMKSFNWEYASAAVSQLAKFHALSMAYRKHNREAFEEDVVRLKADDDKNSSEDIKAVAEGIIKPAIEAVNTEHQSIFVKYLESTDESTYKELYKAKYVDVIIHGDYRPSNLMHRTLEDGKLEVVPIDFQTLRIGSPIVDLLYFIYTGSDEEFRRLHYQQLIDHYYSELSAAMTRLGVDADTYSREDFEDELKEKTFYGIFVGIFLLPIVLVDVEDARKVDEDLEIISLLVNKTSSLFPERFNGIVNDYVRWGILK